MKKLKQNGFLKVIGNKWLIAIVLFLTWIVFFDENSFVAHTETKQQLHDLNDHRQYFKERISSDKQKLQDLNAGKEELEKFAREQYHMSKPDEDVFIVVEESKEK